VKLAPVGRVEDLDELDLDPLEVDIVGYTADKEEVVQAVRFRPLQPTGAALEVLRMTTPDGNVPIAPVMRFLDACILEEDRDLFREFTERPDVFIHQSALLDLFRSLSEHYGDRPTKPRLVSHNGRVTPRQRKSTGGQRSRASTSTRSRSAKGST
jgi:hypothetical protein